MEPMDAWAVFLSTGNVLDYLRYSALKNAQDESEKSDDNTNKKSDNPNNNVIS